VVGDRDCRPPPSHSQSQYSPPLLSRVPESGMPRVFVSSVHALLVIYN